MIIFKYQLSSDQKQYSLLSSIKSFTFFKFTRFKIFIKLLLFNPIFLNSFLSPFFFLIIIIQPIFEMIFQHISFMILKFFHHAYNFFCEFPFLFYFVWYWLRYFYWIFFLFWFAILVLFTWRYYLRETLSWRVQKITLLLSVFGGSYCRKLVLIIIRFDWFIMI